MELHIFIFNIKLLLRLEGIFFVCVWYRGWTKGLHTIQPNSLNCSGWSHICNPPRVLGLHSMNGHDLLLERIHYNCLDFVPLSHLLLTLPFLFCFFFFLDFLFLFILPISFLQNTWAFAINSSASSSLFLCWKKAWFSFCQFLLRHHILPELIQGTITWSAPVAGGVAPMEALPDCSACAAEALKWKENSKGTGVHSGESSLHSSCFTGI